MGIDLGGFLAISALLIVAPGPDMVLVARIRRALDGLTGAVLIGLGARLAFERR